MKKKITINYFALLKEKAQKNQEELDFEGTTLRELYLYLDGLYQFNLPCEVIKVAVNDRFDHLDSILQPHDRVVFIPPVAGG
jgi:molybdopterin synthase sulfur carrier subunit